MKLLKEIFAIALLVLTSLASVAQEEQPDVVLRAMKDELDRSMAELKSPELEKPFFIMYGITDQTNYRIGAVLGAISESYASPYRLKSTTRILVGDYAFNDESMDDNSFSSATALDLEVPVDDDYWGIRRSLWASTDNVYRDAARHFNQHKITVKESKKTLEDLPHRTFGKGKPFTLITTRKTSNFERSKWEKTMRNLSGLFLDHPEIEHSMVSFDFTEGHDYLVNSEGVMTKIPFMMISFYCVAQARNSEGEMFFDLASQEAMSFEKFPSNEELHATVQNVIKNLQTKLSIPKFEDEYVGPVLLMGNSVASLFGNSLFSGRENLMANDDLANTSGYMNTSEIDYMNNKIGKNFMNDAISIVAKPKRKEYNGKDLFGSFEIDAEGIVPEDEVVLVENGILKTQLNNRTVTHKLQTANGFATGPGVLEVTFKTTNTTAVLKERLLDEAKKEGLEYALIIRDDSGMGIPEVFRIWVEDSREERVRNAAPNFVGFKTLRNILAASQAQHVVNLGYNRNQFGNGGFLTSYIVPEALLLRDIDVRALPIPALKEEEYVKSPMTSTK